jgi:hypothetical protein
VDRAEEVSASAHRVMEDDVYKGQLLPAGTTVMDNVWYVTRFLSAFGGSLLNFEKGDVPQRVRLS